MPITSHAKQFFLSTYARRVTLGRKDFYIEWTLDHVTGKDKQGIIAFEGLDVVGGQKISFESLQARNKDELFTDNLEPDSELRVRFYSVKEQSNFFKYLKTGFVAAIGVAAGTYFTVQTAGASLAIVAAGLKEMISDLLKKEKSKDDKEVELGYGAISGEELSQPGLHVIKIIAHEKIFIKQTQEYDPVSNKMKITNHYLKGGMPMAALQIETQ
ncbi:hypothetical protein [Neolewinella persica]|uniref:hypothetical protein n=1 Tax=Neolewinella persica TaxID=70998 RepID=UPI00035C3B7E|nr:hypothetical protein [Neolewinella persica]